ncbi:putative lipo domain protein, partial [Chlamydia psittaci 84-8471/1]
FRNLRLISAEVREDF